MSQLVEDEKAKIGVVFEIVNGALGAKEKFAPWLEGKIWVGGLKSRKKSEVFGR